MKSIAVLPHVWINDSISLWFIGTRTMNQPQAQRAQRRDCATTSSPTKCGKQVQLPPFFYFWQNFGSGKNKRVGSPIPQLQIYTRSYKQQSHRNVQNFWPWMVILEKTLAMYLGSFSSSRVLIAKETWYKYDVAVAKSQR